MVKIRTEVPTVTLNDGVEMPLIGFGIPNTRILFYNLPEDDYIYESYRMAIRSGYQFIQLVTIPTVPEIFESYMKNIGRAIRDSIRERLATRSRLFVCAKIDLHHSNRKRVVEQCKELLSSLGLKYIDLLLLRWIDVNEKTGALQHQKRWARQRGTDITDCTKAWRGMEDCKDLKLARSIGLFNFDTQTIEYILNLPARHRPTVLLRGCHYGVNLNKLLEDCKRHNIVLGTHCPHPSQVPEILISKVPYVVEDPIFVKLSKKYQEPPAKICSRYLIQRGILAIPLSYTFGQIFESIDILDFELSPEEMNMILALDSITVSESGYNQLMELLRSNVESI